MSSEVNPMPAPADLCEETSSVADDEELESQLFFSCIGDRLADQSAVEHKEESPVSSPDLSVSPNNENGYSSGRSSGSTSLSDWKYTPNAYPNANDYDSISAKYNDIIDTWKTKEPADQAIPARVPVKPPRSSVIRKFDPLYSSPAEARVPSPSRSSWSPKEKKRASPLWDSRSLVVDDVRPSAQNYYQDNINRISVQNPFTSYSSYSPDPMDRSSRDSVGTVVSVNSSGDNTTDLTSRLANIKLEDTSIRSNDNTMTNPRPDVLVFAENQQKGKELEEKISHLENDIKDKDSKIEELERDQKKSKEDAARLMELINVFHAINEELVIKCEEAIKSVNADKDQEIGSLKVTIDRLDIENKGLRNRLFMMEEEAKEKSKAAQQSSDNELVTMRVQTKRMEMKLSALQNQLQSKNQENAELSSMVDELISKVHSHR